MLKAFESRSRQIAVKDALLDQARTVGTALVVIENPDQNENEDSNEE
jgi:hypothetical protein